MKSTFYFLLVVIACAVISCGNGDDAADANDTTATITGTTGRPEELPQMLVILHYVKDFHKWKAFFDAHDSLLQGEGLHGFAIGRGLEDSNQVLVALRMDNAQVAREYVEGPGIFTIVERGGNRPDIDFGRLVMLDRSTDTSLDRVMLRHQVDDWNRWRRHFDSTQPQRLNAGLKDRIISRNLDDSNNVTVVFTIAEPGKAKAFLNSNELKQSLDASGVSGRPRLFRYRVVDRN